MTVMTIDNHGNGSCTFLYLPESVCVISPCFFQFFSILRPEVVVQLQLFLSPAEPVLRDQLASHATKHDAASHSLFYNEEQTLCVLSGESERV